jgi:adenylate cyclase
MALFVSAYLFKLPPFYSFSLQFNDINYLQNPKTPSKEIVFVAVDEKSVNTLGRWPWDRVKLAQALLRFKEAKTVVLDMVFSEPTNESSDAQLGDAIGELGNVICGFFFDQKERQGIDESRLELLNDSAIEDINAQSVELTEYNYIEPNIETIMEQCMFNAPFNTIPDIDDRFRRYPAGLVFKDSHYAPLGLSALQVILNKRISLGEVDGEFKVLLGEKALSVDDNGFILLNYYANDALYQTVSIIDVVDGTVPAQFFKDKIVLVGITEAGVTDIRATPIGQIAGPLLHYTFLSNFLNNELIVKKPNIELFIIVLMLLLPFLVLYIVENLFKRALVYGGVLVLFFVLNKVLYLEYNLWMDTFYSINALFLMALLQEYFHFKLKEKESKFVKDAFSSYLSAELLEILSKDPTGLTLGGHKKELSVLFSDIRNFTTISEKIGSAELVKLLNIYFNPMTDSVLEHKGMLDKYIGDAIMAFFNAPIDVENHARESCLCALDMSAKMEAVQAQLMRENLLPKDMAFEIGIGINTAEVVVGNMGADNRFNYTVIGDGVNLASRLEGQTKNYGVKIIISEFTNALVCDEFLTRKLDTIKVKGKDNAVGIYELMVDNKFNLNLKKAYESALNLYENNAFDEAKKAFVLCAKTYNDTASALFLQAKIDSFAKCTVI